MVGLIYKVVLELEVLLVEVAMVLQVIGFRDTILDLKLHIMVV